jgi:hypothetical protein
LAVYPILNDKHSMLMQSVNRTLQVIRCSRDMQWFPLPHVKVGAGIVTKAERILGVQKGRKLDGVTAGSRKFRREGLDALAEAGFHAIVSAVVDNQESPLSSANLA